MIKIAFGILLLLPSLAMAQDAGTVAASAPMVEVIKVVTQQGADVVDLARTGQWAAALSTFITIVMMVAKSFNLWNRIGKRWAYVVPPAISLVGAILATKAGGATWPEAIMVMLSGAGMGMLSDLVNHGVLARQHQEAPLTKPKASA